MSDDFADLDSYDTDLDSGKYDLIFSYVLTLEELNERVWDTIKAERLNPEGYLYIAYPKIGNKTYDTSVHRDAIFPSLGVDDGNGYVGDSTLKFARMVKLDDTFTLVGMKNDVKGKGKPTKASSGNVADYEQFIPDVKKYLEAEHPRCREALCGTDAGLSAGLGPLHLQRQTSRYASKTQNGDARYPRQRPQDEEPLPTVAEGTRVITKAGKCRVAALPCF